MTDAEVLAQVLKLIKENQQLRAALEKIKDGPGNRMESWAFTWAHQFASETLKACAISKEPE